MDYILDEMNNVSAEGVDFVPLNESYFKKQYHLCQIISSYTKEEWINASGNRCIPKTPRLYWKLVDGNKIYL